jgi:hypothetical protein
MEGNVGLSHLVYVTSEGFGFLGVGPLEKEFEIKFQLIVPQFGRYLDKMLI